MEDSDPADVADCPHRQLSRRRSQRCCDSASAVLSCGDSNWRNADLTKKAMNAIVVLETRQQHQQQEKVGTSSSATDLSPTAAAADTVSVQIDSCLREEEDMTTRYKNAENRIGPYRFSSSKTALKNHRTTAESRTSTRPAASARQRTRVTAVCRRNKNINNSSMQPFGSILAMIFVQVLLLLSPPQRMTVFVSSFSIRRQHSQRTSLNSFSSIGSNPAYISTIPVAKDDVHHFTIHSSISSPSPTRRRSLDVRLNSGCHRGSLQLHMSPASPDGDENENATSSHRSTDTDTEWKAVIAAYTLYRAAYGNLKVPQRFVVPDLPPWPAAAHGLKLGRITQTIRSTGGKYLDATTVSARTRQQRRQQLEQLGFKWQMRASPSSADENPGGTNEQVVLAVEAYKNVVNENVAEIPENFVVPETEQWPEIVRGLPLGRQLAAIQKSASEGGDGDGNEELRAQLVALGVSMPLSESHAEEEASSASIDSRSRNAGNDNNFPLTPEMMKRLHAASGKAPGQKLSANDQRFRIVFVALATYKKLYGDLLVPQPFVVPSDGDSSRLWPEPTWGLRLGARVNAIRSQGTFVNNFPQRRALLDEIGFEWSPLLERSRGRTRMGNEQQEQQEPPVAPPAPQTAAGPPVEEPAVSAATVESEDNSSLSSLDSLFDGSFDFGKDFDFPPYDESDDMSTAPTWNLEGARLPAAQAAAAAEQEAARVEAEEYIPPPSLEESLAAATERAIECGVIEGLTENRRVVKGKREKDIPWFNDDFGDDFVFEDVVEALTLYKAMYGDFTNLTRSGGSDFIVPAPEEITGFLDDDDDSDASLLDEFFDIDASARAAAAIASYEDQGRKDRSEDFIAAEIKRLQEEVDQPFDVTELDTESGTQKTVAAVSSGADRATKRASPDQWPEHLAGMTLGYIVTRICDGSLEVKHLPERKKQLDAIGFDWGDPKYFIDIPFEKAMCAMYAYYLVRGDMFVYEDFVMPDEDPWPQALAGYELGKAVKRIRELQNFFEAYHPDKVSLLRTIDFVWFADTVALPLDPNEKEMTPESLLLGAMGHPDYAKMIDMPMGLPDKIMAEGPFFETNDDPKLWWRKWHNWDYVKDYWYQEGRRDNAYVLRKMGYTKMAEEHEAKYGPGLFAQIDEVMQDLENTKLEDKTLEGRRDILEKLNFFRQEMLGCTDLHPQDRDALLMDLDTQMLLIMKNTDLDMAGEDEQESADFEYEDFNGAEEGAALSNDVEEMEEEEFAEEEDFDIEDELGLDDKPRR